MNKKVSDIFGVSVNLENIEYNNLHGDCAKYLKRIPGAKLDLINTLRNENIEGYETAEDIVRSIVNNNRIKNKKIDFSTLGKYYKNYFNARSLDFYMYRLGLSRQYEMTRREGIEQDLYKMYKDTQNLLLMIGEYKGYNSIHWIYGCGCTDWMEANEPDFPEKHKYIRDDLGVYFY